MVALILIAVLAALLAALVFCPVRIRFFLDFTFRRKDFLKIKVSTLGGLIKRSWTSSVADLPGGWYGVWITDHKGRRFLVSHIPKPKRLMKPDIRRLLFIALRRGRIEALQIRSELGVYSDAAATALVTGALRAVTLGFLRAYYPPGSIPGARVEIRPRFDRACFIFQSRCIIISRVEHIIIAGWNNLISKRKKAVTDAGASH